MLNVSRAIRFHHLARFQMGCRQTMRVLGIAFSINVIGLLCLLSIATTIATMQIYI